MDSIDQILAEKLGNWYVGEWPIGNFLLCVIALVLSVILCGLVGIEREKRGRSAGLRTHLLVGVGSCLVMIISIYGFPKVFTRDVARLAAQVVTGVGFLGAGAIIHRNSGTKGLTTAATIWIVMAIGLACGSMNFILATATSLLILLVLTLFRKLEFNINKKNPRIIMRVDSKTPILSTILDLANKIGYSVKELSTELLENGDIEIIFCAVNMNKENNDVDLIVRLGELEGVKDIGLLNK